MTSGSSPIGPIRFGDHGFEQPQEMGLHAADRLALEQVGAVLPDRLDPVLALLDEDGEVDWRGRSLGANLLHRQTLKLGRRTARNEREHHLVEGMPSELPIRLQCADQLLEGQPFVRDRIEHPSPHAAEQIPVRRGSRDVHSEHHGVDEHTNHPVELRAVPTVDGHPDGDVVLTRVSVQEQVERRKEGHVERDALRAGECVQPLDDRRGN